MPLSDYAQVQKTYVFSSSETLGARFVQDAEKGISAGVCVADVEQGGAADRVGVTAGMVIFGVHGQPAEGKTFNRTLHAPVHTARASCSASAVCPSY
jgi:C-terminal processing protease CtpA/Prc